MRRPTTLFREQLDQVYDAIRIVEAGMAWTLTLRGQSWSTIERLYDLAEWVRLDLAIAAIEEGAASYTEGDYTFNRADLQTLYTRRDLILRRQVRSTRKGMPVFYGVPS